MLPGQPRLRFAGNGLDALRLAAEQPPDLVLLDAEMPGMSGLDVCRALKADPRLCEAPVIFVTSHGQAEFEALALAAGAADFIRKPPNAAQLQARVQAWLRQQTSTLAQQAGLALASEDTTPPRLLVVDDDVSAIRFLQVQLASLRAELRFATDGASALALMRQELPDVVLLDARMPGMDGFDVCQRMQADEVLRAVPVVFVTRFADPDFETRALALGATDFIAKPYSPAVLLARVRNLVRLKRRNDAALRALAEHWRRVGDARVAAIVAAASDAVISLDAQQRVLLFNDAASVLFGCASEAVVGRPLAQWLPEADALMQADAESLQRGLLLSRVDGSRFCAEVSRSHSGQADDALTTLILRDGSERERQAAAARAALEAETASRTKTLMLAYLAHEIGNPLNGILGFAQLMAADSLHPLAPDQARRLGLLSDSAWHLNRLMADVLDLSRFESGDFSIASRALDAGAALERAMQALSHDAARAQVRLGWTPPPAPLWLRADADRLHQCLLNLLSNAIKYGRPQGQVELRLETTPTALRIAIEDDGIGLTPEQCTHLFEPFNRAGRGHSSIPGAGIGLALTRKLVQAMGGSIDVRSQADRGSCFTIELPRAEPADQEPGV